MNPNTKELHHQFVMPTTAPGLVLARGKGVSVWDDAGKEYLDFMAGIAVNNVGHCHPAVVAAIAKQAGTLLGVAYMLWLAWKLSRAGQMTAIDTTRLNITFWQGVGLQFVNIKAWMLALTLSAGWVVNASGQPASNPGERLVITCCVMVAFAFSSNFVYALLGSLLRQWLAQGMRLLWFNRVLAVVLVLTAAWMLVL